MDKMIITCRDEAYDLCHRELKNYDKRIRLDRWIDRGIGAVYIPEDFQTTSDKLRRAELIFLRHIFPLDYLVELNGAKPEESAELKKVREELMERLDKGKTFSAQSRVQGSADFNHHDINHFFADCYKAEGYTLEPKSPQQIISAVATGKALYIGLSTAEENLSAWPGGMRRYAKTEDFISRSEMKLLEALETFDIDLSDARTALDLGASPGGWTKVLAEHGLSVTAVDPAELSDKLKRYRNITHYQGVAQNFMRENETQFDIITNDMRMDVAESCRIMVELAGVLKEGGLAVMTFKLPQRGENAAIKKGLQTLEQAYSISHAKQLFHNRSEITVVLKK